MSKVEFDHLIFSKTSKFNLNTLFVLNFMQDQLTLSSSALPSCAQQHPLHHHHHHWCTRRVTSSSPSRCRRRPCIKTYKLRPEFHLANEIGIADDASLSFDLYGKGFFARFCQTISVL